MAWRLSRFHVVIALAMLVSGCDRKASPPTPTPEAPPPSAASTSTRPSPSKRVVAGLTILEMTTGGAQATDALPVIVFIHGMGDRPESFVPWVATWSIRARVVLPRAPHPRPPGYSWFNYPALDDDLDKGVREATRGLGALLEELARERPATAGNIVSGFSQGGILSFALAALRPDLVSHALPISGFLPPTIAPRAGDGGRGNTLFAMHGDEDGMVPIDRDRRSIAVLRGAGIDASLREFPGVRHTITPEMEAEHASRLRAIVPR